MIFECNDRKINFDNKTLVMAILNVTPDSFSEDGKNFALEHAITEVKSMIAAGVDIVDIGGESTRPGADPVDIATELERVIPVITKIREFSDITISIDTWKSEVAEAAMKAGADIINDISGFNRDPELKHVAARTNAGCIAMHMRGTPLTMQNQEFLQYNSFIKDICDYFHTCILNLTSVGVSKNNIMLDPGIGFSKTVEQNFELIKELQAFGKIGCPILLGPSRKSFIGKALNIENPNERVWGTAAAVSCGIMNGANVVRVHDYKQMIEVAKIADLCR